MVFIKHLNKELWPYFVYPKQEEIFSSWFCRLIFEHDIKPLPFINNYFANDNILFNRDIDILSPSHLIEVIISHTPLKLDQILSLFLKSYEGYAFEKLNSNTYTSNVLPLGINHRKRKLFGQMFCPSCLNNDGYYKKEWRLVTSVLCTKCKIYLLDRCPKCNSEIAFHRINIGRQKNKLLPLNHCYKCSYDLGQSPSICLESESELVYQNFIDETIRNGYNKTSRYSFQYINMLLHLSKKILSNNKKGKFRNNFSLFFSKEFIPVPKQFCFLSVKERKDVLVCMNYMLMNWPTTFNLIREIDNFNNSEIIDKIDNAPFWMSYNLKF